MKIVGINVNAASTSESHWLARQLHDSAGATGQGNRNKMFRGWFCSSIEMLRGSCSFLQLEGVTGFIGLVAGEGVEQITRMLLSYVKKHTQTYFQQH